ncbi:MAG: hypothetical protein ACRDD1_07085 [Planctomycetia bacterium]
MQDEDRENETGWRGRLRWISAAALAGTAAVVLAPAGEYRGKWRMADYQWRDRKPDKVVSTPAERALASATTQFQRTRAEALLQLGGRWTMTQPKAAEGFFVVRRRLDDRQTWKIEREGEGGKPTNLFGGATDAKESLLLRLEEQAAGGVRIDLYYNGDLFAVGKFEESPYSKPTFVVTSTAARQEKMVFRRE